MSNIETNGVKSSATQYDAKTTPETFDGWFAEVKADERWFERERILALLGDAYNNEMDEGLLDGLLRAIALIKGEQK